MKSINKIILLDLIHKQTTANKQAIFDIFTTLVDQTDVFFRLEKLLNENIFIDTEATDIYHSSVEMLNRARSNPADALNAFLRLEELIIRTEHMAAESKESLERTEYYDKKPAVVSKIDAATFTKYYEEMYKALTYFVAVLCGPEGLEGWKALPIGSFSDIINFVDTQLPEIIRSDDKIKGKWHIEKKYFSGGVTGVSYDGYCVVYEEQLSDFERTGDALMPYIRQGNKDGKIICSGLGYIVGLNVGNVNSVFDGEVVTKIYARNVEIPNYVSESVLCNPIKFITEVLQTNRFIVTPEDYVALLNKYCMKKTMNYRRNSSRCVLCASKLSGNDVEICSNHFVYNFADCLPEGWPENLPMPT